MNFSFYSNFLNGLSNQEAQVATLQQQMSTGSMVQNAAQNPAAYESAALANDQITQLTNDTTTQSAIQTQLGAANSAYSSVNSLLDNVQSIVEQSLNSTTSTQNLNSLAAQVQSASQQLLSLGNTQLPNGSYLFGGSRGNIAPFQVNSSGVVGYYGDAGQSQANIDGNALANTLVNGATLTSTLSGNGTSFVTANYDNKGTGQVLQDGLTNTAAASAFQAGSNRITVTFSQNSSGQTTYTANEVPGQFSTSNGTSVFTPTPNATQTQLASGVVSTASGSQTNLSVLGMNFSLTGSPASGDSFTIDPSRPQTAFSLLQGITTALNGTRSTAAQVAQTNQALNQYLAGIGQYQQSVTVAQAQNGITLQAVSNAQNNTTAQKNTAQATVNAATAVNMPATITALNQTMTAIEASMKAFAEAQSLSLFKYL